MKIDNIVPPLHPAGWPFVGIAASITLLLFFVSTALFLAGFVLTAFCLFFFRDPDRVTPVRSGLIVSPADGRVVAITSVVPDDEFGLGNAPRTRISIFLDVFNVHVNRIPADGKIVAQRYRSGKFFNASFDKASVDNERMALTIKLEGSHSRAGENIAVAQIAGLIARRIVCDAKENQSVKAGDRFGIIRFGSRTDVYLPLGAHALVTVGQTMIGGETVLADLVSTEDARKGEVRP